MKMMRPGLYEYQVAAKMVEIHAYAGCETEAYAPIVGTGINSTVLHYNKLDRRIEDGDVVLMDVAGQYSGYASDITRTIPAERKILCRGSAKFTKSFWARRTPRWRRSNPA